jgi:endonuclease/exonuclease/phosphatase family metal-dependent hydrolase
VDATGTVDELTVAGSDRPARRRRRWVSLLVWLLVLPVAAVTVLRLVGITHVWVLVTGLSFTPYVALAALLPLALAAATRRRLATAVAALLVVVLAVLVVPRFLGGPQSPTGGPALRVATANMRIGGASPRSLVALVRANRIDLLAVQEYTAHAQQALHSAGLDRLLPHRAAYPVDGVGGSALYSRYPLTGGGYRPLPPFFGQAHAVLHVPGAPSILVESAHPCAPSDPSRLSDWRHDLTVEPSATPRGPVRILLGDFNATLDHAPFQHLLSTGYHDAAATVGNGWDASWPYDGKPLPGIALDHVLVDPRIAVRTTAIHPNPNSDHHALTAALDLPRA